MGSVFDISAKDSPDDISLYILDYLYNMQDNIRQWTYAFLEGCAPRFGLTSDCCDNLRRSNVVVGKLLQLHKTLTPFGPSISTYSGDIDH